MAKFSKRHYLALSRELSDMRNEFTLQERRTLDYVTARLAGVFKLDNEAFDQDKFYTASRMGLRP